MMARCLTALTFLLVLVPLAHATEYIKTVALTNLGSQATRPVQTSTQDNDFVSFGVSPAWAVNGGSGGIGCPQGGAALPSGYPLLRAIALTAITTGASVIITVVDSLPTIGGYCQVTTLAIVSS